jgi:hypothetical protein
MMRVVFPLILVSVFLCISVSVTYAFMAGDTNVDGVVDVGDVVYEINYLFKHGPYPLCLDCADVNGDCGINVGDVVYLVNYLFKSGAEPQIPQCDWSEPVNIGAPINTSYTENCISFSADGNELILSSNRPGTYGNDDIWYSIKDDSSRNWINIINCGPNLNTEIDERNPCISPDGNKIYFATYEKPGGQGSWDIWVSTWDSLNGEWGIPQNLGLNVNSDGMDWTPFITYDGNRLYFSSNRYWWGISFCEREGEGWGPANWLGSIVNDNGTEECPTLTADGRTLYFSRWIQEVPEGDLIPHIFVSYWTGIEWAVPVELPPQINYPEAGGWTPWISPDGTRLYFSAGSRPGSLGGGDLWVSNRIPSKKGKAFINR